MITVTYLHCWHANELIYQADGGTDDGRDVYVHFRGDRLSVWCGVGPVDDPNAPGEWVIEAERHPGQSPATITRATLEAWAGDRVRWPDRIDGYHNEPGDAGDRTAPADGTDPPASPGG